MAAGAGSSQNPIIQRSTARPDMTRSDGTRPDTARIDAVRPASVAGAARRHRAELLHSIASFERALTVPAADPEWRREVDALLSRLREAFSEHVDVTEGPEGLYGELVNHAPRLARGIDGLKREHADLLARMDGLHGRVHRPDPTIEQVRRWASELLDELWQHRQRGADLVYEAYATDIGGET
jgi:hypothetical protein